MTANLVEPGRQANVCAVLAHCPMAGKMIRYQRYRTPHFQCEPNLMPSCHVVSHLLNPLTKYVMTLALALALPLRAGASGQEICHGQGIVICAPLAGAAMLTPKSLENKIIDAINKPDLPALKKLLARHRDALKTFQLLDQAISDYVHPVSVNVWQDEAESISRLEIIEYLLARDTNIDHKVLSGLLIHRMVPMEAEAQVRVMKVARLLIAHGGSYANIDLDVYSTGRQMSAELVTLMLENRADANQLGRSGNPVTLNYLAAMAAGNRVLADRLIQLGANPGLCAPQTSL